MSRARHLARGFTGAVRAREPHSADVVWVKLVLSDDEFACWEQMSRADRVESIAVGRGVAVALGRDADDRWVAAALLHDVGKTDAGIGAVRRAGATIVAAVVSHGRARHWPNRIGRYVAHDDLGAARLERAGARPEAVSWAAAHHRPEQWASSGIPLEICEILAAADEDR
jgi:HD domain